MHGYCRCSRVPVLIGKNIVEPPAEGINHPRVGEDGDIALPEEERPDVVDSGRVVCVLVRE